MRSSFKISLTLLMVAAPAVARDVLVLTSTNGASNEIVVFKLSGTSTPELSLAGTVPTGGAGGAAGNAGSVQFEGNMGAVVNYGSNTVSMLNRGGDSINVNGTIKLTAGCTGPASVSLTAHDVFVAGSTCAVMLPDTSAGQIAVGESWAAVTLKSGSVLQLPLNNQGALSGASSSVALPSVANNTPLGAAFRGDLLGFNPAHSSDSLALVNAQKQVFPIPGPQPSFPTNAP